MDSHPSSGLSNFSVIIWEQGIFITNFEGASPR